MRETVGQDRQSSRPLGTIGLTSSDLFLRADLLLPVAPQRPGASGIQTKIGKWLLSFGCHDKEALGKPGRERQQLKQRDIWDIIFDESLAVPV